MHRIGVRPDEDRTKGCEYGNEGQEPDRLRKPDLICEPPGDRRPQSPRSEIESENETRSQSEISGQELLREHERD